MTQSTDDQPAALHSPYTPHHFQLVHGLKRRIRVLIPQYKKDIERLYCFEILLRKRPAVKQVRVTPQIASVVIEFDERAIRQATLLKQIDTLLGNLGNASLFAATESTELPSSDAAVQDIQFALDGLTCVSCGLLIEMLLQRDARIQKVAVNFASETATVTGRIERTELFRRLQAMGFKASPLDTVAQRQLLVEREQRRIRQARKRFIWASILGVPVVVSGMLMPTARWIHWAQALLTTPVVFWHGGTFFRKAGKLAMQGASNMDTLIALGVGSAYGYSLPALLRGQSKLYFEAAAGIVVFVLLGRYLEENAKGKAGAALRKLIDLQPRTATVLQGDGEVIVAVDALESGMQVLVRPGERIPTDGDVIAGLSSVDESMVTGESMPVVKEPGQPVIGGCINGTGVLTLRVTAVGADTVLAGIIQMVDQAQASRLPIQKTVDRISAVFVPVVMGLSGLTFLGWLSAGAGFATAFGHAITVLLIACPCSLGLATPAAIMVGTGKAARRGIFIRNGESLETATQLSVVVFDKTGTITEGKPQVTDVLNASSTWSDDEILTLVAAAEYSSEHFLARAIVAEAQSRGLSLPPAHEFAATPGRGLRAVVREHALLIGNQVWLTEQGIESTTLNTQARLLSKQGKTPVFVALDGEAVALIAIADQPRLNAGAAIQRLQALGIEARMATGDVSEAAEYVAAQVGIEHVLAQAAPDQKLALVRALQLEGEQVGMIGDGINDAPALAAAHVSFSVGSGTDVAIETADLTLINGDIGKVAEAIEVSTDTLRIIHQNLFWAFAYNTVSIPVAMLGRLNPMVASAAMALSSVSVVLNSLRISRMRDEIQ